MEHKPSSHIPVGFLNDLKYQSTPQNGAILLAKLQQKVARLEIALRDKETELVKLNSSSKASYVNELKIQTEVYYQEVLRLKNQLNRLQETKIQPQVTLNDEQAEKKSHKKAIKDAETQAQNIDRSLLRSIEKLKEENENLSTKLSLIQADKERLAAEYRNLMLQTQEQDSNKASVEEITTQTSPRTDSPRTDSLPHSPRTRISDETLHLLKFQIEELQSKEKAWEEERATYKELVLSLKEDRIFFKDTSQKRHDELWSLQKELVKLQKDIGGLQLNGKPLCKQCTKPSYRTTKLTRKIVVKDIGTTTTPRHSTSQEISNNSSAEISLKKNSSSGSPKRLPTPLKSLQKGGSHSSVSKSPSSTTTSSSSSSTQPSPEHSVTKKPPKPLAKSSSMRTSLSHQEKLSSRTPSGSSQREKLSSRTTSGSSLSTDDPQASTSKKIQRSGSLSSPKRIISPSSPSKLNLGKEGESPAKRTAQRSLSLRGKPEIAQQRRERQSSLSSNNSTKTSESQTKLLEDEKIDEEIALEILRDLDTLDTDETLIDEQKNHDTGFPSSRSSQTPEEEAEPSGSHSQGESGCGDSQEIENEDDVSSEKISSINSLLGLLESHLNRKKKLIDWQTLHKTSPPSNMNSSPVSKLTSSKKNSELKSTSNKVLHNSKGKGSPKAKFSPKTSLSTPKKIPPKSPKVVQKALKSNPVGDGENMKDIDKMICLLEGHIARTAFLTLHATQ